MTVAVSGPRRSRRWLLTGSIALLMLGAGATWAVLTVLRPATDPLEATPYTFVTVSQGEVGADIGLNTLAAWTLSPVGANRASGVVTSIGISPGDEVVQGSTLYTVDLKPVVVAQGAVPAFRSIGADVDGPDVAQLQQMLVALGFYPGPADGDAGAGTVRAITAWQKSMGVEQTGTVDVGDVIFVPSLPIRVSLDNKVVFRGASLTGGEAVVSGLPLSPVFTIPVTDTQAGLMPAGTQVEITSPTGNVWTAVTADQVRDDQSGTVTVNLQSADGSVICGSECAAVPVTGETLLSSRIVTVATVTGLVVPSSALVTGADGQVAVVDEEGTRHPVAVEASARGMSVITGVNEGLEVRVPGLADAGTG